MTKDRSFKQAVRRHARETGLSYVEARAAMEGGAVAARVRKWTKWRRVDDLPTHLERRYGIRVDAMVRLSPHGAGVFRVDRSDGRPWVARIFPSGTRSRELLDGDVDILRFLEDTDFPAERCAHTEPLTMFAGQHVLLTEFVPGRAASFAPDEQYAIAGSIGRLHALSSAVSPLRDGGAWGHDPAHSGAPREDLRAALAYLDAVTAQVPDERRRPLETLREALAGADGCDGLPLALTTPRVGGPNVILNAERGHVFIDWKSAGRGERLAALAHMLQAAISQTGGTRATFDVRVVEAIASGYKNHIRLEPRELARLKGVIRLHQLYFAAWRYWRTVTSGTVPLGSEPWWPNVELTDAIADEAVRCLTTGASVHD